MLKIGNSSVIAGREDGGIIGLEGILKGLQAIAKFQPHSPQLNFTVKLEGLSIRGKFPVVTLQSLLIDAKVSLQDSNSF